MRAGAEGEDIPLGAACGPFMNSLCILGLSPEEGEEKKCLPVLL